MDATEARQLTAQGIDRIIEDDNEQARLAELAEQEHLNLIANLALEFHQRIDVSVAEAASAGRNFIEFIHEQPEPLGDEPDEAEFSHYRDIHEAHSMLCDQLKQEGFRVQTSGVNQQGFTGTVWSRWEYHLNISWSVPELESKNVFHKIFNRFVKHP
jgi:hypothetical protein